MTTHHDPRIRPAQNPTPTTGTDTGEGVKAVAPFESRKNRRKRAWDEMSEIDRAVLLESVRQRRKAQETQRSVYSEIYGLRNNR